MHKHRVNVSCIKNISQTKHIISLDEFAALIFFKTSSIFLEFLNPNRDLIIQSTAFDIKCV